MEENIIAVDSSKNYNEFVSLNDSADENFTAVTIAKSLGVFNAELQTVMVCGKFDPIDSIIVDYYTSPIQLLTSIICGSVDSSTPQTLYKYFDAFLKTLKLEEDNSSLLDSISTLDTRIASSGVVGLDSVLKDNSDLVNRMYNLIKLNFIVFPFKTFEGGFNSWKLNCDSSIGIEVPSKLFISRITWRNSRMMYPVNVVIGSRFCNGLFPIKKSKLDDTTLNDDTVAKCFYKLKEHEKDQFLYQQFLYDKRNCNSIVYSCYLLKSVESVLRGVLIDG